MTSRAVASSRTAQAGGVPLSVSRHTAQLLPWLLASVLVSIIGLSVWTHQRWREAVSTMVSQTDLLATARTQVAEAEVLTERWLSGDVSARPEQVLAKLDRAATAGEDLIAGRASQLGLDHPVALVDGELLAQAQAYRKAIGEVRARVLAELRQTRTPAFVVDLRQAHARLSEAGMALERALAEASRQRLRLQTLLAAFGIGLLAAMAFSLYAWLYAVERRRAQSLRDLIASESRNRAFIETVPELAFVIEAGGRVQEVFAAVPSLLQVPREQVIGRPLEELFPPEVAAEYLQVVRQALAEGRTQRHEYTLPVPQGLRVFEARVAAIPGTDRAFWACWDVTQRVEDHRRLAHLTRMHAFLSQVNRAIAWERDRVGLLRQLVERAVAHGGFDVAWVGWLGDDGAWQTLAFGGQPGREALEAALCRQAADPQAWIAQAVASEAGLCCEPVAPADLGPAPPEACAGLRRRAALPLSIGGIVRGVLVLLCERAEAETPDERSLLGEVGSGLSRALTHLEREAQRQAIEARMRLHAAALEGTRDGVMMLDEVHRVVFVNRAFSAITGVPAEQAIGCQAEALGLGQPLEAGSPVWPEVAASGSWQGEVDGLRASGEPHTLWMSISAVGEAPSTPPQEARHRVVVFTDVSHLRVAEARLERLAEFDPLTNLPNRSQVLLRLGLALDAARRQQAMLAVFYIDLDHFRTINDSLGHTAGDALLAAVADRLRGIAPAEAVLGRLGGDEFLLGVTPCAGSSQAVGIAQSVLDTLKTPLRLPDGREFYTQASVGISLFPQDGDEAGDLIRDADTALHQAKAAGRNTYRFYIGALTHAVTARLEMETRLRRALDRGDFELAYQPVLRLADGALLGVEALVRMRAGDGALVHPAAFIPLMEETGLIVALGDWVRREACRQAAAWRDQGFHFGSIAVNVSSVEIARGGLVERLQQALQAHDLPPSCLEVEITESGLMEHGDRAEAMVAGLAALGVKVSLDDFGTGYSSLAYLKRFRVDTLKIDRSFIRDLPGDAQDAKLVGAIIAMGHSLDLTVLAEGVETAAQADFLRLRGCQAAQGFLFSMPVDADSLVRRYGTGPGLRALDGAQAGGAAGA